MADNGTRMFLALGALAMTRGLDQDSATVMVIDGDTVTITRSCPTGAVVGVQQPSHDRELPGGASSLPAWPIEAEDYSMTRWMTAVAS